ncbi:hypothetical protein ACOMCU_00565 [Lysinibacillus sp. UGB7]|uniref:hypothetical protein n=1 Tax=Lysinibacillus sp. UGB7 TaxID=3411039 RepID=UPI003B7B0106
MIDVPKKIEIGQKMVNLDYSYCDLAEAYVVDALFVEEYNPSHAYHENGQPSIRVVETLEQHIGEIIVRSNTKDSFIVKVRIDHFVNRTEANIVINKDDAKAVGITRFDIAKKNLPKMKGFILLQINRQYPHFWDLDY